MVILRYDKKYFLLLEFVRNNCLSSHIPKILRMYLWVENPDMAKIKKIISQLLNRLKFSRTKIDK